MKFLQLTDIHLTAPGKTIAGRDPNANFVKALDHATRNHPDAEALIITGDLSDWGEKEDYVRLREMIANVPMPVILCIGNHDERDVFLSEFPDLADENGFVQRIFPLSGGVGIALDTWGPDTHAGHYCEARRKWLDQTLSEIDVPVFLFMHHNPVPIEISPMDAIMLQDADAFGEVIAAHREKIAHIFHGHCHLPLSGSLHGVPFSAPRGTNHAGWPNFDAEKSLSGADLAEAYAVIFAKDASVMVHMVEFGYGGQIRSEGSPDYADWNQLTMIR